MSKKLRLTMKTEMTLQEGIAEFYLNCEARNLRPGTIKHYKDSVVQIYKVVPPETPIHEETGAECFETNHCKLYCKVGQ